MKITFTSLGRPEANPLAENEASAKQLALPSVGRAAVPHLAVVGGGPSIMLHVKTLKAWGGDVWAVNGAYGWCQARGIDAVFFSSDPTPLIVPFCRDAKRAVVALSCDPAVFCALNGSDVRTFSLNDHPSGPSTATAAPSLAIIGAGYESVTFFGCESSFSGNDTHTYGSRDLSTLMKVRCNGDDFLTTPDMLMQAEFLADMIRAAPALYSERSGGLLAARIVDPEVDVIAATQKIHDGLTRQNAI